MQTQLELSSLKRQWIDESIARLTSFNLTQFTADDLHRLLEEPPHENWMGCLVAKLRCAGKIREVGRVKSSRKERNGAKVSLWAVVCSQKNK